MEGVRCKGEGGRGEEGSKKAEQGRTGEVGEEERGEEDHGQPWSRGIKRDIALKDE
jgi:hypothetical protein